jgi:uncharacterized protein (TIGR02996 family)
VATSRSRGSALFPAILDEPDVDDHRLVYADWLEEQGQPERAEFIRVQCLLATVAGDDPRRFGLAERERDLLAKHKVAWTADLPKWVRDHVQHGVTFRRGFVEQLRCTITGFLNGLGGLLRRTPLRAAALERIKPGHLERLAAHPGLGRLTSLDLAGVDPEAFRRLAESPHLTDLRRLGIYWQPLTLPLLLRLFDGPLGARLTDLHLGGLLGMEDGLAALVAHPVCERLTSLNYSKQPLVADEIRPLTESPRVARLTSLALSSYGSSGAGILPLLAASPYLKNLASLQLYCGGIPETDIEALAASPHLRNLTDLSLGWAGLTPRGWESLLRSPNLTRLTRLRVADTVADVPRRYGLVPLHGLTELTGFWVPR